MNVYEFHKSNPDIFQQFSIKDILFLYYKCPQKEKILQLHSPYNQLTFSITGKRIFHQGDYTYDVSENSGFLLRRAGFLQEMDDKIKGWELMAFYLKDDYLKEIFNEFRSHLPLSNLPPPPKEMVISMDINDSIRNCYLSLIPYFEQKGPLPEKLLEIKLKELLYNVFTNPKNRNILSYINNLTDGHTTPIWEVMEANYMYNLKLSEYAQLANRSLSSFKREFEGFYGTTPGKWLIEKRIERAKSFIETTRKPIGDIAFENGFNNLSHFSRVFKNKYGNSPSYFRK
ncbi:AraC family transcriptional regulator [Galbibacter sp. EGI 63066]|uniref:helix-turn-helix domain-containing protein n=1 Tax=Galbibacter sp. EGI 63066 TaxID=2993559 RepID=UPI0022488395|nr:AraC family transcriptional regulator [Galbibacter sp. EGI 63066]MCX2680193.1 AraC family transcriptional regulator [Galbibacter sp. EGI 63066]